MQTNEWETPSCPRFAEYQAIALRPNEPFTWSSGMKSPIYCVQPGYLLVPRGPQPDRGSFAAIIRERFPEAEVIAGIATGGIPHGALVAEKLGCR